MKKARIALFAAWTALEFCLYASFLILDFFFDSPTVCLKYAGIVLLLIYVALDALIVRRISVFFALGLLFTLVADTFLLLIDDFYWIGLISFNLVQNLYFLGLQKEIRFFRIHALLRLALYIVVPIAGGITGEWEVILSGSYLLCLLANIVVLAFFCPKSRNNRILLLGWLLFLACDINVGLFNLGNYFSLPANVQNALMDISGNLMWLFYLPSQYLIALYAVRSADKRKSPV